MGPQPPSPPASAYTRAQLEAMDVDDLDAMVFGVIGGQVVAMCPSQVNIRYHCDLENPQALFDAKGMAWARSVDLSEPIDIERDMDVEDPSGRRGFYPGAW